MSAARFLRTVTARSICSQRSAFAFAASSTVSPVASVALRARPQPAAVRTYVTQASEKKRGGSKFVWIASGLVGITAGYYFFSSEQIVKKTSAAVSSKSAGVDYQNVYNQIADILEDNDWDDGSWGPIFLRLGWHAAGTYDKGTNTGGSNGATMRFPQEGGYAANNGLKAARDKLEAIKAKNPNISYSDLWSLGAVCAIQEMGGPTIPWVPGRVDADVSVTTPDGRLPDASQGAAHLREIFNRMGFTDGEIVALSGAHALGRCHTDRSGFEGPWTFSPTMVTNGYYTELLGRKWVEKKWKGPKQYVDKETGELMMLPTDLVLIQDPKFKPWVEKYAEDESAWTADFASAFRKLQELGVPRTGKETVYHLKRTDEQK